MEKGLVKNWMSSPVITVTAQTPVVEARQLANEKNIRALPVMDGDKLIGIITRRGLLRMDVSYLEDENKKLDLELSHEVVGKVMTKNPLTILPNSFIPKAARIMLENKINSLPVVENGKLVGILTSSDIMRFILSEYHGLSKPIAVNKYMTDEVVTIMAEDSLLEAHRLMGIKRIRCLPVVEGEKMVGIITRTDLMCSDPSRYAAGNQQQTSLKVLTQPVEKIMVKPVITISPDASLVDAVKTIHEHKFHCLPVTGRDDKLVGVITESDLFLMVVQKFF